MLRYLILLLAVASSPALAQQQQPQGFTPSQMAVQIDAAVGQMAQQLEAAQAEIARLKQEISKMKAGQEKPESK